MLPHLFAGVAVISLVSLAGVLFLAWKDRPSLMGNPSILAFATGTILGTSFLHLVPESFEFLPGIEAGVIMLASALFLFFLETWLGLDCKHRHHHHTEECHGDHHHPIKPLVWVNLLGDGVHNFIDGALLATVFMVDINLGWMAVLAIALHEIPQELSDFLILRHGGLSVKRALLCNLLGAMTAFAGASLVVFFSDATGMTEYLFPVGAGCFLYLAMVDLLPEVKKMIEVRKDNWIFPFFAIAAGIALMAFLATKGHVGHDHSSHDHSKTHGHSDHSQHDHGHSHGHEGQHDHDGGHSHGFGELSDPKDILERMEIQKKKAPSTDHSGHDHSAHGHQH